jgi:hypothetical protein
MVGRGQWGSFNPYLFLHVLCDTRLIPNPYSDLLMEAHCSYLQWDLFDSFKWVRYLLKAFVTLFCMTETGNGILVSTNLITHLNLVPSCCEIMKMCWHCVLFIHSLCTEVTAWIQMWCVKRGVCRGKAISDLHFKLFQGGKPPEVAILP